MFNIKILFAYDRFVKNVLGPAYRTLGQRMFRYGASMQGNMTSDDRLVQNLINVSHEGRSPVFNRVAFVAPNSVLVGQVSLGENSSVWYGSKLRGDRQPVFVGRNTVVQDNSYINGVTLGDNVFVGPNTVLDKCQLESDVFVGMGSTVRPGAKVAGILAAGSVLRENEQVGAGEIWAGSPAKYLRDITPEELQILKEHKQEILDLSFIHAEENNKDFREIIDDTDFRVRRQAQSLDDQAFEVVAKMNLPVEDEDEEFIEHRVFLKDQGYWDDDKHALDQLDPYEHDMEDYPENFKLYKEDYEIYERAKKFFEQNPTAQARHAEKPAQPVEESPWTKRI